jgi:serine protease
MRLHSLYAALCGLLLVFTSLVTAQDTYFRIAVKLTQEGNEEQQTNPDYLPSLITKVSTKVANVSVGPLIQSPKSRQFLRRAASSAALGRRSEPLPNFDLWYEVEVPLIDAPGLDSSEDDIPKIPGEINEIIDALYKSDDVESAHALYPCPPPAINPSDDPLSVTQTYMNAAPDGINARYGWTFPGGDGAGVSVVDVEQGFNFNHEDLVGCLDFSFHINRCEMANRDH